ncbi:MAG: hypothetical protein EPO28_12045 [Saprospiraceae bacterium]|nr:MAG: hypothetical protein EPO28_12045 [Saprospiraceae bacterium]
MVRATFQYWRKKLKKKTAPTHGFVPVVPRTAGTPKLLLRGRNGVEIEGIRSKKTTGYDKLNEVIRRTRANNAELLVILDHPALPLHNNAAVPYWND